MGWEGVGCSRDSPSPSGGGEGKQSCMSGVMRCSGVKWGGVGCHELGRDSWPAREATPRTCENLAVPYPLSVVVYTDFRKPEAPPTNLVCV